MCGLGFAQLNATLGFAQLNATLFAVTHCGNGPSCGGNQKCNGEETAMSNGPFWRAHGYGVCEGGYTKCENKHEMLKCCDKRGCPHPYVDHLPSCPLDGKTYRNAPQICVTTPKGVARTHMLIICQAVHWMEKPIEMHLKYV